MSRYSPKKVIHITFDDVFYYADEHFGVGWDDANDLFFGNAFEYNQIDHVEIEEHYLELSVDEINSLSPHEKANAILSKFLDTIGIADDSDEIYIDSK